MNAPLAPPALVPEKQAVSQERPGAHKQYLIADTFRINTAGKKSSIVGMVPGMPGVPMLDPLYYFDPDRIRAMVVFWNTGLKAMLLEGDPAVGKSSLVVQWHAHLNIPLEVVVCSPQTQAQDLFGRLMPSKDGQLAWADGPVTKACRHGTSVLLDEANLMDPGEASGLNLILEGGGWTIPETGEYLQPQRNTRFFATQNSVDSKALVAGRQVMDVANEDRYYFMEMDFLPLKAEIEVVTNKLLSSKVPPDPASAIAQQCVTIAHKVRQAFRDGNPAIDKPISTRTVLRWAITTFAWTMALRSEKGKPQSAGAAMHKALPNIVKMSDAMLTAVHQMVTLHLGIDENGNDA